MTMRVGVVGCGPIAESYVNAARRFPHLHFVACAGRTARSPSANALANRHGLRAMRYEEMLAGDVVDIVLVLTPAHAHLEPAIDAIAACKHVYCEKPLATSMADARTLVSAATARGVRLGCAPDTVLGAAIQRAAAIVDSGEIGVVTSGIAALGSRGMEHWHPDPSHFYQPGGGPVMDKGPYYIAALVTLLGPIARVRADGRRAFDRRVISAPGSARRGQSIEVNVLTTVHATLHFHSGAIVTLIASWDIASHALPDLELYGTAGSVRLGDPNWFGGTVHTHGSGDGRCEEMADHVLGAITMTDVAGVPRADHRGIGLAEMVLGLEEGTQPLCSGALALHVLETLTAIVDSADSGAGVALSSIEATFELPRLDEARARSIATSG